MIATALFMIGNGIVITPLIIMWLDGFIGNPGDDESDLIRWLMHKSLPQIETMRQMIPFGFLVMAISTVMSATK